MTRKSVFDRQESECDQEFGGTCLRAVSLFVNEVSVRNVSFWHSFFVHHNCFTMVMVYKTK